MTLNIPQLPDNGGFIASRSMETHQTTNESFAHLPLSCRSKPPPGPVLKFIRSRADLKNLTIRYSKDRKIRGQARSVCVTPPERPLITGLGGYLKSWLFKRFWSNGPKIISPGWTAFQLIPFHPARHLAPRVSTAGPGHPGLARRPKNRPRRT